MPSLITSSDVTSLTGDAFNHFLTFCRDIVVFKEPIKTVVSSSSDVYAGYGNSSEQQNVTLTPVSGIYSAIVKYNDDQKEGDPILNLNTTIPNGRARIKVAESGKVFIEAGKTECIDLDGYKYNLASTARVQNFLGLKFYVYYLERTN